jgi:DNA-binding NarL/FixJ family response regulator
LNPSLATTDDEVAEITGLRDIAMAASDASPADAPNMCALWRALVEGRFRLVERFERNGQRYYVLRENLEEAQSFRQLEPRERRLATILGWGESEKAAAYALGVTPSAISAILKTTLAKLGLRSRVDLVLLVRSLRVETAA